MTTETSGFQLAQDAAAAYERETRVFMLPLAQALLDVAGVGRGQHVLDLACGTGVTSREAAGRVGPEGRVVGADVNAGMIEVARAISPDDIEWHVASALDLPFEDAAFDVVVAQQGVQFFPDLDVALAQMRRVARPGGTIAASVWTPMPTSPYLHAQFVALSEVLPSEVMTSFTAAFRLGPDDLTAAWQRAGVHDVQVEERAPSVTLPPLREYVPRHLAATPWGPPFASLEDDGREHVHARLADLLADHTADGVVTVPFSTWVVSGRI